MYNGAGRVILRTLIIQNIALHWFALLVPVHNGALYEQNLLFEGPRRSFPVFMTFLWEPASPTMAIRTTLDSEKAIILALSSIVPRIELSSVGASIWANVSNNNDKDKKHVFAVDVSKNIHFLRFSMFVMF